MTLREEFVAVQVRCDRLAQKVGAVANDVAGGAGPFAELDHTLASPAPRRAVAPATGGTRPFSHTPPGLLCAANRRWSVRGRV